MSVKQRINKKKYNNFLILVIFRLIDTIIKIEKKSLIKFDLSPVKKLPINIKIKKNIIITRGDKGAIAINRGEVIECEAQKNLQIKDLTGAGDLFAAGYLHGIINNLSIKECLIQGTELSSKIIQKIGARI